MVNIPHNHHNLVGSHYIPGVLWENPIAMLMCALVGHEVLRDYWPRWYMLRSIPLISFRTNNKCFVIKTLYIYLYCNLEFIWHLKYSTFVMTFEKPWHYIYEQILGLSGVFNLRGYIPSRVLNLMNNLVLKTRTPTGNISTTPTTLPRAAELSHIWAWNFTMLFLLIDSKYLNTWRLG